MTMDKHQNIFYSYNQGDLSDIDREVQLEDNVTKALINLLENSDRQVTVDFLKRFVNSKIRLGRTEFQYALQKNLVGESHKTAQETPHKFILGISPTGKMDEKSRTIVGLEREEEKLKGIKAQIKNILRNENEVEGSKIVDRFIKLLNANKIQFDSRKQDINVSDINYLYQLLASKSRPDGWIVNKNIAVLIENKIWGKLSSNQIDRHNNKWFNGKGESKPASWKKIYNFFKEESSRNDLGEVTKFLVKQFTEYLEVIGLAGFTEIPFNDSTPYDLDDAKNILRNLMVEIEKEIGDLDKSLERRGRPLEDPWDYFGEESLHFTVGLWEEWAGLDLFVKKGKYLTKLRKNPALIFEEIERLSSCLGDYWLDTQYWRLHDWKRGKQRGPMASFEGYFVKLARLMEKGRNWKEVVKFMLKMSRHQKAFQIEKRFFYKSKKHQSLLQSPNFSQEVVKGIKELLPLYQELRTSVS